MNPYYIHPHCLTEKLIRSFSLETQSRGSLFEESSGDSAEGNSTQCMALPYDLRRGTSKTGHWWRRELLAVGPPIEPKLLGRSIMGSRLLRPIITQPLSTRRRCLALCWL